MQSSLLKKVKEASYLTAEKTWSYRPILRYFYIQHERMREFLFPEEIYEHLRQFEQFKDYSMESLHQDLSALTSWGNLIARQELGNAKTVEEFKKKRFRYQCTPYTVEFERMLMQLEQIGENFGGSLEKTQFERLYQVLTKISSIVKGDLRETDEECSQMWEDVMTYFRQITQNTSDYIAYINSEEVADRMQTDAFLVYKDQFTTYLRDFIIALQQTALQTQDLLSYLTTRELHSFFQQVLRHQQQTFRFDKGENLDHLEELIERWTNLKAWFLGNEHRESEFEMLQNRTSEAIRRITRIVQRLGERQQQFRSRKKDYLHLAKWFDEMTSIEEAHKLSSVAFGVFHTRHLYLEHIPTDDIYLDIWEEAPMEYKTKPRIRQYGEKTRANAIDDNQHEKEEMRRLHLKQRRYEQKVVEQYINGDEIKIKDLPTVEPHVRKLLLSWIGKAMVRADRTVKTEFGSRVKIILNSNERTLLKSEDGTLEMPHVTFKFIK
ncbi:uncharacterized protein (TIGR02677 family) [Desulfitispora alkaliphila]|uniref:TIGR02677 family protein n=1 Tax=Desulfitispora alkaliphila TaxID=622674 RepID=UPI003D1A2A8C